MAAGTITNIVKLREIDGVIYASSLRYRSKTSADSISNVLLVIQEKYTESH